MTTIWFFECKGYLESIADEVQMGWASQDYQKRTADTGLAMSFYAGRLANPGQFRRVMFEDGKTGGRSQVGFGEAELQNEDQELDKLRHFAFDGRDGKLMRGTLGSDGALVAGSLVTELEFEIAQPRPPFNRYRFAIVDRLAKFANEAMQPTKFAGTGPANDVNAEPGTAVFDGDLIGSIDGTPVGTVTDAVTNFDARNDRKSTTPADPVIATGGTAVDHVVNTDGSVDISLEWTFGGSGDAYDIDGFLIYVRSSSSATAYVMGTTAAEETVLTLPADKRAMILTGVAANKHYTFGVQAYRRVDPDVNAAEILKSAIVQPGEATEDPYQPSSSVAFAGSITGTISGASDAGALVPLDQVDTGQIVANAVTDADVVTTTAGLILSGSGFSLIQELFVQTGGDPVLVQASFASQIRENGSGATVTIYWYLERDSTGLLGSSGAPRGGGTSWDNKLVENSPSGQVLDAGTTGGHYYQLFARASSTAATTAVAFSRTITVTRLKR